MTPGSASAAFTRVQNVAGPPWVSRGSTMAARYTDRVECVNEFGCGTRPHLQGGGELFLPLWAAPHDDGRRGCGGRSLPEDGLQLLHEQGGADRRSDLRGGAQGQHQSQEEPG